MHFDKDEQREGFGVNLRLNAVKIVNKGSKRIVFLRWIIKVLCLTVMNSYDSIGTIVSHLCLKGIQGSKSS